MVSRQAGLLLAALVALAGVSVVGGEVVDAPPTLTVENDGDTTYRVTAYTVESVEDALLTNFRVTTPAGENRLVTYSQLVWPAGYRNVTVTDSVPSQQVTVPPNEAVETEIRVWEPGDVTIYIIEEPDDETHVWSDMKACTERQQEHSIRLRDGYEGGGSTCASDLDLLFR
ncbi:hypothetical protein [Haloarcula onubensis]|uniref:Uncharacterized protein n=1 Tax=Haloarcula onubensis TaxID=2950539 RepID=A0ABU2FJN7_9EURY|nr:hypothetical protein [Halomicroarcula sp. S3CR25-11]MDS0280975.1 hypothetical protein [Halomicroarcula sp. S3CR25-11]